MKKLLLFVFALSFSAYTNAQDDPITASSLGFEFKIYNQGTAFTAITLDSINKRVWAGTNQNGIYNINLVEDNIPTGNFSNFNGSGSNPDLSQIITKDMAADQSGNIWVAHQGINFSGGSGGMEKIGTDLSVQHYSPDRNALGFQFLERDGLGGLRLNSVTVDRNNRVWTVNRNHNLTSGSTFILTPGDISYKDASSSKFVTKAAWFDSSGNIAVKPGELPYPAFTINPGITETPQSRNMQAISTDSTKVVIGSWGYIPQNDETNFIPNRLLQYNLVGEFIAQYTFEDMNIPSGGIINGVCTNNSKGTWVTTSFTGKGFSVLYNGEWTYMNPSEDPINKIIPTGTRFNDNAIWKNGYGNVFLGTNQGLLVYDGRGPANEASSYTFYSNNNVFPNGSPFSVIDTSMTSNNIASGVSEKNGIQWMATDNGIMRAQIGNISTGKFKNINGTMLYTSNPRSVNNVHINYDVDQFEQRTCSQDATCHRFEIKTVIVGPNSPNSKYATVEKVYHMMKELAKFQAITPHDIPAPVLGDDFLEEITQNQEDIVRFNELVNMETEKITNVNDVMQRDPNTFSKYGDITNENFLTWLGGVFTNAPPSNSPDYYAQKQLAENNEKCINGETYRLYSVQEAINTRDIFVKNYTEAPWPFTPIKERETCQGIGLRSIEYDPIVMFIDDKNYKMVNYTEEGHIFHPGTITRTIKRDNDTGEIYVLTEGDGFHFCAGEVGVWIGKTNHIVGSVVFKNVDFRFKEAFENITQD